jgi:tRNA(Ser,Leu) C12 N-acetylase TAN1
MGFNLLVSIAAWAPGRSRREIVARLRGVGDPAPVVEATERRGIVAVSTCLDPRAVVRALRALHKEAPDAFRYTLRWTPVDLWCGPDLESLRQAVTGLRARIAPGERWRMNVERRTATGPPPSEIIAGLADLVDAKVDLSHPDRILRIEMFTDRAALAVVAPDETLSVLRAQ